MIKVVAQSYIGRIASIFSADSIDVYGGSLNDFRNQVSGVH